MITYRYGPYDPDEEPAWNLDKLMGVLSDMIMKYDVALDEALRMLLNRGLPVNLFLKTGGMQDLLQGFADQIEGQITELSDRFHLNEAFREAEAELRRKERTARLQLKNEDDRAQMKEALGRHSVDALLRLKWESMRESGGGPLARALDDLVKSQEQLNTLENGARRYSFRGDEALSLADAIKVIAHLDELSNLKESLAEAMRNGDLFNFNLENLARYLGPESYQEFLERREQIMENLRRLMEEQGAIVTDEEGGESRLSPASLRRIGRRAIEEIFKDMKADSTGGAHQTDQIGEADNVAAVARAMEYGDAAANIDVTGSVMNALIRRGSPRPQLSDLEVFESRGTARGATVVLLDMSGSMLRADRFYNAKKVVLALDSLIREEFRDDRLTIVGFGSLAQVYQPSEVPTLQPFPVTMFNPHIRLRLDLANRSEGGEALLPLYFTNLQRGLRLSHSLLGSGEVQNKQIILITDGVPTAHFENSVLHINYPPSPADFEAALREARACTQDGIVINTFLLTSDWETNYFGEESFILQFAKQSMGRIFYPHPGELNKMILVDFIANKKQQFSV